MRISDWFSDVCSSDLSTSSTAFTMRSEASTGGSGIGSGGSGMMTVRLVTTVDWALPNVLFPAVAVTSLTREVPAAGEYAGRLNAQVVVAPAGRAVASVVGAAARVQERSAAARTSTGVASPDHVAVRVAMVRGWFPVLVRATPT